MSDFDDSALALLRQPQFLRLWATRLAGTGGSQMLMVALGWQMYDLTGSAWDLGLVGLAQFVPALLLTLPAGHWADRHDRRRLVALALAVQAAVGLVLALGSWQQWVGRGLILALSVVLGAMRALQMPAQQALLPSVVLPRELARATALASSGLQAAIIAGPALGGALYAAGGAVTVYGTSAALFAVAVACMVGLRPRPVERLREAATWAKLMAGVHFIRGRPVMLGAISLDLFAVLLGGATALLPIFARDILDAGPTALGLLRAAPAVGALAMSVALAHRPLQRHVGRWLLAAVAVYGACMIVFGLSTSLVLSWLALAASGAADMVSVVIRQTLVQLETPEAMRGRVGAVNSVFIGASNQLGEFESGVTAAWWGPVASVVVGGASTLAVVGLWWRLFPSLVQRDRLHEHDALPR
ncbi:MFS transporter [Azohydromonas sediminis]|uniref:MFS transporter n=1 Tax=Azohydromonas sediminis TaxID=2259674 RepID=UPI000E659C65|nr:MFS transporter [Azohydromonas sediminis]